VREYLAEFLSDPFVVDYPRALWAPVLHGVVLNVRPRKTARAYARIWLEGESPLLRFTRRQAERLALRLPDMRVDFAMRYGAPSLAGRLSALRAEGVLEVGVVPLYPQYSRTTTGSVATAIEAALSAMRDPPVIAVAPAFFEHPLYIEALARSYRGHAPGFAPERALLSFHSLPERLVRKGDPYKEQCEATARLLRRAMGWTDDFAPLTYQSRFGPEKWLGPSTLGEARRLAKSGVQRLAVMTPGFMADCLETLDEIAVRVRGAFLDAGGAEFAAIPCLNDSDGAIDLLEALSAIRRP
jgi:ferrochelatase